MYLNEGEREASLAESAKHQKPLRHRFSRFRYRSSPGVRFLYAALAIFFALTLAGCGGGGGSSYVTGITVSPSASVASGDTVTVTVTVSDSTLFKSAKWTADGGSLSASTGLAVQWIAPTITVASDFTLKVAVQQTNGLTDNEKVIIHVSPVSAIVSGARITSVSSSPTSVNPGEVATLTVAVASQADVADGPRWQADSGTLLSDQGYSVQWRAPSNVTSDQQATLTVTTLGVNGDAHSAQVKVVVLASGGGSTSGARITGATASAAVANPGGIITATVTVADASQVSSVRWSANIGTLVSNQGYSVQWRAPSNVASDQQATLTVTVTGVSGDVHTSQVNVLVQATGGDTSGARITGVSTSAAVANPGDVITATVTVADTTQVASVQWASDIGTFVTDQGLSVQWRAPDNLTADQYATLTATSRGVNGDAHTAQVKVYVKAGTSSGASLINKITVSSGSVTAGQSISISVDLASPGTVQSVTWAANGGTLTNQVGTATSWVAPEVGTQTVYIITVTVKDNSGQTSSQPIQVVATPRAA
jgi:hypothetical protein